MDPQHWFNASYAALGALVGVLVGLTGVGGGSLMTPLLILLFGVHPVTAVGTDLLFAASTKSLGTVVNGFNRTVDWRMVARLAIGSLPATALTLFIISRNDINDPVAAAIIRVVLIVALLVTSLSLIARKQIRAFASARIGRPSARTRALLTIGTGFLLGVVVSLTSVGAGAVGMVALLILYPEAPMARLIGSDIAHAVPLTLLAGFGHWMLGSVDLAVLGSLLVGSLPGIVVGCYAAPHLPDRVLRLILALTLVAVAMRMIA